MKKSKIGVVALVTADYSGNERAQTFYQNACASMKRKGIAVLEADRIVQDPADAVHVCEQMCDQICGLVIIDINWVMDSLQYIFTNTLRVPVLLWALPYNETYSLACVHHFSTVLHWQQQPCSFVCGSFDDDEVLHQLHVFSRVAFAIEKMSAMRIGLVGPRQTWRVAGAQDMMREELTFSKKFGVTILHVEMREVEKVAEELDAQQVENAREVLLKRTGVVMIEKQAMNYMVRMYLAIKEIMKKYSLDAVAAETVPFDSGIMNIQSSWLADEGIVVDTEGDISHTVLQYVLNAFSQTPAFLGEICSYDGDVVNIYHEGSSAHSLARSFDDVFVLKSGENGCYIGLSMKAMNMVTVVSFVGYDGNYQMFIDRASVEEASHEEWEQAGTGCLAKLNFHTDGKIMTGYLMEKQLDHHYIIKPGDFYEEMKMLCRYLDIETVIR